MAKQQAKLITSDNDKRSFLYSRLLTVLIIVGGVFALAYMWKSKQRLQIITILGIKTLTEQEILERTGIEQDEHPYLREIQLAEIRLKIKQHPFVRSAIVAHGENGKIIITIEERLPIAALKAGNGELKYIDRDGVVLPYRLFSVVSDVPIVHGIESNGKIDTGIISNLVLILKELQNTNDGELYQAMSEIFYQQPTNSFVLRSTESGISINLGKTYDLPQKFEHLFRFWTSEFPRLEKKSIEYIDLRWEGQVVLKKKITTKNNT
jgi:hypothetical protein